MKFHKRTRALHLTLVFQLASLLLTLLVGQVFPPAGGAEACGKKGVCICQNDCEANGSFLVLCNDTKPEEVPKNIPVNVTVLSFYRRNVTSFTTKNIFQLTNLEILLLTKNKISTLEKDTFHTCSRLRRIYLNENYLRELPVNIFSSLRNLTELNMDGNLLNKLHEKVFRGLKSLKTLSMRDNQLCKLPKTIFADCGNLRHLDISGNNLYSLPVEIFTSLKELNLLNLTMNNLRDLPNGIFNTTTKLKHLYVEHNQLQKLSHLLIKDLQNMQYFYVGSNRITNLSQDFKFPDGVKYIKMSNNSLVELPQNFLEGIRHLISILLDRNKIRCITEEFSKHRRLVQLTLSNNNLQQIPKDMATPLQHLYELDLSHNNISIIPDPLFNKSDKLKSLSFSSNIIKEFNADVFCGLHEIHWLYLSRNGISDLPEEIFSKFNLTGTLDLSSNSLIKIPVDIFQKEGQPHQLEVLLLQRNNLTSISPGVFKNLPKLKTICLFNNKIYFFANKIFYGHGIKYVYLFGNRISELKNQSFQELNYTEIHIYRNDLSRIEDNAMSKAGDNTTLFLSCDRLAEISQTVSSQIKCVTPTYVPKITVDFNVVNYFRGEGFQCTYIDHLTYECMACQRGTYGNGKDGCIPCPKGGFYQDDIGVTPSRPGELACKMCTIGTYSNTTGATSAEDCKVCPEGTNKDVHAGFRACPCIDGYARNDRFGPCEQCAEEGVNCTGQDFRTIQPGYFWSWTFNGTDLQNYIYYAGNLTIENFSYNKNQSYYKGEFPQVHKCPRQSNCENKLDNITGSCAKGYKGWLCTKCEVQYYSVMNNCFPCPSALFFLLEAALVVVICICFYLIVLWRYKTQQKNNKGERSILDVLFARVKIVLGFYQVVGEFFKSLNEVKWVGKLYVIGEFISYLELNILKMFIRPQCIKEDLVINPKVEFIIGMSFPLACVAFAAVLYRIKKILFGYRYPGSLTTEYQQKIHSKVMTYLVVVLFVTYPPICTTVFQLYPRACQKFCLDVHKLHCIRKLRSDYDINCTDLTLYHYLAYIATFCYVISFPTFLLYLLKKYRSHGSISKHGETLRSCRASNEELESLIKSEDVNQSQPSWWLFLCESYKEEYWYWEIIELTRKVTQTVLITLLGWDHKLTVLLTIGISVLFLTLHARFMPMKSVFEQRLQMFSLTAILINVLVAGMDFSEKYDDVISNFLILLNVVVIVIIAADALFRLLNNLRKIGFHKILVSGGKKTFFIRMKKL